MLRRVRQHDYKPLRMLKMNDKRILNPTVNPEDALVVLMETVKNVPLPMEANTLIRVSEKTLRDFIATHTESASEPEVLKEAPFEPEVAPLNGA